MPKDKQPRRVPDAEKLRTETPEQKQAFEEYFLMADDRSFRRLAKSMNKGVTTISNWSKWFNWQERIDERERQVDKIVEARSNKTMAELRLEQARKIDAVMERFWANVEKGKVELESWQDFERLWKIRQEIGGETDRKKSNMLAELTKSIADVGSTIIQAREQAERESREQSESGDE